MRILSGKRAQSLENAVVLAFEDAGMADMSPRVATLFASAIDRRKLEAEAGKEVNKAIRSRYGNVTLWEDQKWYVPVPALRFEAKGLPVLAAECRAWLVAVVEVERPRNSRPFYATVVGALGKPSTLTIPLLWLQALLDEDPGRFPIVARDGGSTSWRVPGHKGGGLPHSHAGFQPMPKAVKSRMVNHRW